jgi:hypothetical protein
MNFQTLNHLFQECTTGAFARYAEVSNNFTKVLDEMSTWIDNRFRNKKGCLY